MDPKWGLGRNHWQGREGSGSCNGVLLLLVGFGGLAHRVLIVSRFTLLSSRWWGKDHGILRVKVKAWLGKSISLTQFPSLPVEK